jgi:hypothetical protein
MAATSGTAIGKRAKNRIMSARLPARQARSSQICKRVSNALISAWLGFPYAAHERRLLLGFTAEPAET